MDYTSDEIKEVLWNIFTIYADKIILTNNEDNNYIFDVYFNDNISVDKMNDLSQEIYESDLFDYIDLKNSILTIKYLNLLIMEYKYFILCENVSKFKTFSDEQVKYYQTLFNSLNIKYSQNKFFKTIMDRLKSENKLAIKQFNELDYLIKNGKTMYENGYLTKKN